MKYREYCAAQESEIETLRGLLRKHGIQDLVPSELPLPVKTIDVIAEVNQVDEKPESLEETSVSETDNEISSEHSSPSHTSYVQT